MKISVIGAGKMGTAIIKGLINSGFNPSDISVKTGHYNNALKLKDSLGITPIKELSEITDTTAIILATPANLILKTLTELQPNKLTDTPIISVAAGITFDQMEATASQMPVLRCIPNTPVEINDGMISYSANNFLTPNQKELCLSILDKLGETIEVPEDKLGIAGTVAGCSPAFVDVFIEALSDAAVANGLDRASSYQIVAQMMKGSANLALQTGEHPGVLKDNVTSPGGDTIKGVVALEKNNFRFAVIDAINTILKD